MPVTRDEFAVAASEAYIALLMLPEGERLKVQYPLCLLRNVLARYNQIPLEELQDEYEARALRRKTGKI